MTAKPPPPPDWSNIGVVRVAARPAPPKRRIRLGLGRIIAVQLAIACAAGGFALNPVLFAPAVLVPALAFLRWHDRWAWTHLTIWLNGRGGEPAAGDDLGLAHRLVPALEITEHVDRNRIPVGIAGDGRGFAAVLELSADEVELRDLVSWLRSDRAAPAGVQVLTERFFLPPWDTTRGYRPTADYRALGAAFPVAVRAWLVVRHEPLWSPAVVAYGSDRVQGTTATALLRLRDELARRGVRTAVLSAAAVRALLRELGGPADGSVKKNAWVGPERVHCCLSAMPRDQADWDELQQATAEVEQVITSVALSADGATTTSTTVVRLVGAVPGLVAKVRQRMLNAGLCQDLPHDQEAGVVATLPLGCPTRTDSAALGVVRR
ncbi:hypothetical protein LZ318_34010 [Saccharopolyspora indica]|uniref:type VII secretion protein EccE n=1 Tax=Saccharopolyspora indica TaxID=1229659 RepID=UPI0022EA2680|nr:hypothetical protein [Saccharopolyspora indica]MDA3647482.1 hypothetical protein [Saccharopolyspora indica]